MDENYATLWEAVGDVMPDRVAIVQGNRRRTWREFDDRAARFAGVLDDLGVHADGKVAFLLWNCVEYLEGVHAAFKQRAVPINVNFRYQPDELVYVLDDADVEVLVFHGALAGRVDAARARLPRLRSVIQVDDGSPHLEGALAFEDVVAAREPAPRIPRSGQDIFIIYTGGTTGRPKGVMWRQADLFTTLAAASYNLVGVPPPSRIDEVGPLARDIVARGLASVMLPASPLIHGTALYLSQSALCLGGSVVFLEERAFNPHEVWATVARERVSQIAIVGDVFGRPLVQALEEAKERGHPYDISSLQRIVSSGTMFSLPVKEALAAWGSDDLRIFDMLGSSEGGPFGVNVTTKQAAAGTARFQLGDRAILITEDGRRIPSGSDEVGLLAVGGSVPLGYYKDPERTARLIRTIDGERWCVPGDHARFDTDGSIVLLGRGASCINTGGEKVYPEEVEEALKECPGVADSLVVGIPDERWGERVVAIVEPRSGQTVSDADLIRRLHERMAGYKVPRVLVVVEHVMRSPAGKPDYAWARRVAAGEPGSASR